MPDLNPLYRDRLFALIDGAPFVRHMGMRITDIALIKDGKRPSYAEAEVRGEDGRLVAHGTSTLMRLPGLGVKLEIPLWVG